MSAHWIKMRCDLHSHPKVVRIVSALNADVCPQGVQLSSEKFRVVGGLHAVWSLFDTHSEDGELLGYTPETLDAVLGFPGLARAMVAVGWLEVTAQAIVLPEFDTHNGQSAKRRVQEADRKRSVRNASASNADKKRTREEKIREEKKEDISAKSAAPKAKAKPAQTPLPADFALSDAVKAWAAKNGHAQLDDRLAHFVGAAKAKGYAYADWDAALMNAIREDWAKLGKPSTASRPGGGRKEL